MDDLLPSNNLEAYQKPLSLWRLVEEVVSPGERPDIRDILGISLVEQSLELHEEVDNLVIIWQDYRTETDEELPSSPIGGPLPEPLGMRENLTSHIRMLLDCVREKAKEEGREVDVLLARHNNNVLDYVTSDQSRNASPGALQRPGSSWSSRDGRETPMRMTPSSDSDAMSGTSTVSDQVDSVKEQLNILRIDEVANQLRSSLEEEIAQLIKDSKFLQECLEDEMDFRCQSRMSAISREPTIQELKEERSKLEKAYQSSPQPSSVGIINSVKGRNRSLPSSPKRLPSPLGPSSGGTSKIRPSPPPSATASGRGGAPVKASHHTGHPASLPPAHPKPLRRTSDTALTRGANASMGRNAIQRTDSPGKSPSPISGLRGTSNSPVSGVQRAPNSPTRLQPSPPSSARPPPSRAGSGGSGRFRHRVVEAKQSR